MADSYHLLSTYYTPGTVLIMSLILLTSQKTKQQQQQNPSEEKMLLLSLFYIKKIKAYKHYVTFLKLI